MLNEYKAILNNGEITWLDPMPNLQNTPIKIVVLHDTNQSQKQRKLGFMRGEIKVPDDINFGDDEVAKLFGMGL